MSKFVTIAFRSGITMRPFAEGDEAGEVKVNKSVGTLRIHESDQEASDFMDLFWSERGFDPATRLGNRLKKELQYSLLGKK